MDKKIKFTPNSMIEMEVDTTKRVAIVLSKETAIDLQFPVEVPFARLLGTWIVECKNNRILLRENQTGASKTGLDISFEEKDIKMQIAIVTGAGSESQVLDKVNDIHVTSDELAFGEEKEETSGTSPLKMTVTGGTRTSEETVTVTDTKTTVDTKTTTDTKTSTGAKVYAETATDTEEILKLRKELEQEQLKTKRLQQVLEARMDDFIKQAGTERGGLSGDAQRKLDECEALLSEKAKQAVVMEQLDDRKKKIEDELTACEKAMHEKEDQLLAMEDSVKAKESEMEAIKKKMEDLKAQGEVTELDCDKAMEELEELKTRFTFDQETIELLESSDYRLKKGTVSKTFVEIEKELEKVEKKIGLFIKIRTKFNKAVETAIFEGDGSIPIIVESGGENDGNGSTTAAEN